MQGDLDVPQAFSAGGIVVSGIKGKEALTADALHVSKHLHTSLLDSDRVRSEVLSTNIIQSPTGELRASRSAGWPRRPGAAHAPRRARRSQGSRALPPCRAR